MKEILDSDGKSGIKVLIGVGFLFLLLGLGVGQSLGLFSAGTSPNLAVGGPQGLPQFVSLAKKLRPVVVNISATQVADAVEIFPNPFGQEEPSGEFRERFFGDLPRGSFRQRSLGSGFIIGSDGSILTNHHVIENARKIVVKLADGREFEARVIGKDPKTDIALIKINAHGNLSVAPLGDSDRLQVGEWIVAIGNPFGLDNTVTAGIVSAKGRHIGAGPYDNFIQTDASINPGNSGGPLINTRGEVVGISTAIVSQTGGNIGIGFATPISLVKEVLPQLKAKGKVTRGWFGVAVQKVTPEIAESLGLDKARGALVAQVSKDAPAERAGIKMGDVIIEFDGKEIKDSNDLPIVVARTPVDRRVRVKVLREKKDMNLSVTIGELKEEEVARPRGRKAPRG